MRGRTVLILFLLVVALVAFIELYEGDLPSSQERAEIARRVFGDLLPDDVEALEIAQQGEVTRIERRSDSSRENGDWWWITEPLEGRADGQLVDGLVDSLVGLEKGRSLADFNRREAGLNPPRLVVTLFSASREVDLEIGSDVPAGNSMLAAVGEEIVVVDGDVWPDLARSPGDWRSRQVIHRTQAQITEIGLESSGLGVEFARRGQEFWLQEPLEDRADATRVGDLMTAVASMRIATFIDDSSASRAQMALEPPVGVVELRSDSEDGMSRIVWGAADPTDGSRHFAMADGQIFTTDTDLLPFFEASVEEWRSRRVTSMETFQIDRLEIQQPGEGVLTLVREGADWQRNQDKISFTTVSELLYAISGLEAAEILADVPAESLAAGSNSPVLEVAMSGDERQQIATFYPGPKGGVSVTIDDRQVVLWVTDNEFAEVLAKIVGVRAAESLKTDDDE